MPVSFRVIPDYSLVHIVYTGHVTIKDLKEEFPKCYQHPDHRAGMSQVSDLSQIDSIDIGFDELFAYAKQSLRDHSVRAVPITLCYVGASDTTRNALDMYEGLTGAAQIPITAYEVESYADVLAVLDLPPEAIEAFSELRP